MPATDQTPNFAFLDHEGPKLFAHRGGNAAGDDVENTMVAFASAVELGFEYLETDVILSADGQVMAIHGSKNEKQAANTGLMERAKLQEMTAGDIAKVLIGGEPIPTLAEVLTTFPDTRVNIDPKTKEVARPLGRLIRQLGAVDRVCIGAFDARRTKAAADELGGQKRVCTAAGMMGSAGIKLIPILGGHLQGEAACLQLPYRPSDLLGSGIEHPLVTERLVERAHRGGKEVHVWTINDLGNMVGALRAGVDGIISDEVLVLQQLVKQS